MAAIPVINPNPSPFHGPIPGQGGDGQTPYLHVDRFPHATACLNVTDGRLDTETMFDSYQEALDWRSSLTRDFLDRDETIPVSVEQKKALVKLLLVAFKSIAKATDNEPMIKPFRDQRHDNGRVEVICWMLLEAAIRRAKFGPLLHAWDPAKAKYNSHLHTFAERFDEMVKSLAMSKTICKHLYDAPYANHFVDDPVNARKRVYSNRELNKRKGAMMAKVKVKKDDTKGEPGDNNAKAETQTFQPTTYGDFLTPSLPSTLGAGQVLGTTAYDYPYDPTMGQVNESTDYSGSTAHGTPSVSTMTPFQTPSWATMDQYPDLTSMAELSSPIQASRGQSMLSQFPQLSQAFHYPANPQDANDNNNDRVIFGTGQQFPDFTGPTQVPPMPSPPPILPVVPTRLLPVRSASVRAATQSDDNTGVTRSTTPDSVADVRDDDDADGEWVPEEQDAKKRRN